MEMDWARGREKTRNSTVLGSRLSIAGTAGEAELDVVAGKLPDHVLHVENGIVGSIDLAEVVNCGLEMLAPTGIPLGAVRVDMGNHVPAKALEEGMAVVLIR